MYTDFFLNLFSMIYYNIIVVDKFYKSKYDISTVVKLNKNVKINHKMFILYRVMS